MKLFFRILVTSLISLSVLSNISLAQETARDNIEEIASETLNIVPTAIPVLTPEEAEVAQQEAIRVYDQKKDYDKKSDYTVKEWRKNSNNLFFKRILLALLCAIPASILVSCFLKKGKANREDVFKALISLICTFFLLILLFSSIPYFYNFWSIGNLCIGCLIWYTLFNNFNSIFVFSKKDIMFFPLLLLGTFMLLCYVNPRMRDISNTIILNAETTGILTYEGTISNDKNIRSKADFLAHYEYIQLNDGWEQEGSYRASLKKEKKEKKEKKGTLTLHLPTELITRYDLCIKLTAADAGAKGSFSVNGGSESLWQFSEKEHLISLNNNGDLLHPEKKNCPVFFLLLCVTGGFLSLLLLLRLTEGLCDLFSSNKQKAFELTLLLFCVLFCVANMKNAFFIDNCSDLAGMASAAIPEHFSTKHPPIIYAWWMVARFFSPFESINVAFVFGTLISFWSGMWLLGTFLIRRNHPFIALFILLSCVNLVSSTMYKSTLLVDQIVVSSCFLTIGLCTRIVFVSKYYRIVLSAFVAILIMVISSVRLEGLAYTFPISIVFVSLTFFEKKRGFKRVFLSGLLGCILAFSLFSCYRYIISPYVFHARVVKSTRAAADSLYIEALGICYFEKDWSDLPEYFSEGAKANLDKTRYIERTRKYTDKYISSEDFDPDQLQTFWINMIKKYPMTYLHVKWIANQVLWRLRPLYKTPHDVEVDAVPEKTGLSIDDFFRDGMSTFGLVLPSWIPQLSLLFVFLFVGILLLKYTDPELWIIWGIGASGFLHNLAFFLVAGGTNYRYIFWADTAGRISFFFLILVIIKLWEYKQKNNKTSSINENNAKDNSNETLYSNTLFQ